MTFNNEIIFTAVMYLPVKQIGNLDSSISQLLFFWCTLTQDQLKRHKYLQTPSMRITFAPPGFEPTTSSTWPGSANHSAMPPLRLEHIASVTDRGCCSCNNEVLQLLSTSTTVSEWSLFSHLARIHVTNQRLTNQLYGHFQCMACP